MSIKRYDWKPGFRIVEQSDGPYVLYTDHIAALEAVEATGPSPSSSVTGDSHELVRKLRHLIALNEPHNGGPYQGFAAAECIEAMVEAEAVLERFHEALEMICDQDIRPYRCAAIARAALSMIGAPNYLDFITPDDVFDKGPEAVRLWQEAKATAVSIVPSPALEANQQEAINLIEWIEDYALADPDLGEIASRAGKARDLLLALLTHTTRTNQRAER